MSNFLHTLCQDEPVARANTESVARATIESAAYFVVFGCGIVRSLHEMNSQNASQIE